MDLATWIFNSNVDSFYAQRSGSQIWIIFYFRKRDRHQNFVLLLIYVLFLVFMFYLLHKFGGFFTLLVSHSNKGEKLKKYWNCSPQWNIRNDPDMHPDPDLVQDAEPSHDIKFDPDSHWNGKEQPLHCFGNELADWRHKIKFRINGYTYIKMWTYGIKVKY